LVVIDEAGSPGYKRFFETACEIEKIVAALQQMATLKSAKGVYSDWDVSGDIDPKH
jgi:hypothetical protein